jgi:hypothetical protein
LGNNGNTYEHEAPSVPPVYDSETRKEIDNLNNEISKRRNELEKVRKFMNLDQGIDPAFLSLFDHEYKFEDYTLVFLQDLKKNWESLGTFRSIEGNEMKFGGGSYCWQIQGSREAVLKMVCSNESRLLNVMETSTCRYSGIFGTESVCKEEEVKNLRGFSTNELRKIATDIDLKLR